MEIPTSSVLSGHHLFLGNVNGNRELARAIIDFCFGELKQGNFFWVIVCVEDRKQADLVRGLIAQEFDSKAREAILLGRNTEADLYDRLNGLIWAMWPGRVYSEEEISSLRALYRKSQPTQFGRC